MFDMKYLSFFLIGILPGLTWASEGEICDVQKDSISFISDWKVGESKVKVFSTQDGKELLVDHGTTVFVGDLNNDNIDDFIFEASTGVGSSGDRVFSFLLQCHGYLKLVGADYFAKVEVQESGSGQGGVFKDIKIFSYKRESNGRIKYEGGEPLTTAHVWRFNYESQKYEGESE
ncbi:hypothetical protein ACIGEI_24055 [Pseudomonas sp. NPDC078863]|jgi:hypothetical protein|uniref:hypothetical protein n=1 Tax=unclassified Pseudomonas TaxID=196821 RepID=UPI0037CBA176